MTRKKRWTSGEERGKLSGRTARKEADGVADVFISYHAKSVGEKSAGQLVPKIAVVLENSGITCWYAERDLKKYSGSFAATITREIRACKVFLLILNKESNQSEHVKNEVSLGFQRIREHEPMKPVYFKIDNCTLSDDMAYYLNRFQITDGSPPDAPHVKKLVGQIAYILRQDSERATNDTKTRTATAQSTKSPAKIVDSNMCGQNVMYTLDETGMLTISGSGNMRDFYDEKTNSPNPPWWDKREMISLVRIKDGVTNIGNCAFYGCPNLISVYIPESVIKIGNLAFHSCALISVYIPDSVAEIGDGAFADCSKLTDILVNPKNSAYNCLEGILFSKDMSNLICYPSGKSNTQYSIPSHVVSIEAGAFLGSVNLRNIYIPNSVKHIKHGAFANCSITDVHIPNSVISIGSCAFLNCTELSNVHIPDSVTNIGEYAFHGTKLTRISVSPKAEINHDAFPEITSVQLKAIGLLDALLDFLIDLLKSLLNFLTDLSKR